MEFSFGYDSDMNFTFGLHVPNRRFDIFDVKDCILQIDINSKILPVFRNWALKYKFPPFRYSDGEGFIRSLFVRDGKRSENLMLNLVTSHDVPDNFAKALEELAESLKNSDLLFPQPICL